MKREYLAVLVVCFATGLTLASDKKMSIKNKYLNLPVTYNEDDRTSIEIIIDGKGEIWLDCYLADKEPDFWVFVDVSEFKGKEAVIRSDRDDKTEGLKQIYQSDKRDYLYDLYQEKHRPQLHFSTMRGWM